MLTWAIMLLAGGFLAIASMFAGLALGAILREVSRQRSGANKTKRP